LITRLGDGRANLRKERELPPAGYLDGARRLRRHRNPTPVAPRYGILQRSPTQRDLTVSGDLDFCGLRGTIHGCRQVAGASPQHLSMDRVISGRGQTSSSYGGGRTGPWTPRVSAGLRRSDRPHHEGRDQ
jgi:hypothetical protein